MSVAAPVRLNIGAGDDRREGYLSVDLRADVADIVAPASDLSALEDGSVEEILALDILEHFWRDDVSAILTEWHRVLRSEGRLTVRVPNLYMLARQIIRGTMVEATIRNIYGGHRWGPGGSWDAHHWGYTPQMLHTTLSANGFRVLRNDGKANMTVEAVRV